MWFRYACNPENGLKKFINYLEKMNFKKIKSDLHQDYTIIFAYLPNMDKEEALNLNIEIMGKFRNKPIFRDGLLENDENHKGSYKKLLLTND